VSAVESRLTAVAAPRDAPSRSWSQSVATLAERSLLLEVDTWPKPGLVSGRDNGSHTDMDAATFRRSAAAIRPFLGQLVEAGMLNLDMPALRKIGLGAERAMLNATDGVNTHRGAIFGLGLLCAAAGLRAKGHIDADISLGQVVALRWGRDIVSGPRLPCSHGEMAARRHGAGGARQEATRGFPSVYEVAIPAMKEARHLRSGDDEAARVQACFALIAVLEDTNLLHRGGAEGLRFAQRIAQDFLDRGGVRQPDWLKVAAAIHRTFVGRRLSPGGSADVLAMSLFVEEFEAAGKLSWPSLCRPIP
jgi:triphosphoribosyl-dephospho-CoA synthase